MTLFLNEITVNKNMVPFDGGVMIAMSKDEKNKFDLISYLKFFRKFMLNVSIYTAIIYFISTIFFNIETSAIIYAIAVCIPWPYFIIISNKRFIK